MFGEYAVYCDEKVVAFTSGGLLYLKVSTADPELFTRTETVPMFAGSKDYRRVPADALDDTDWLRAAVQATAIALPPPLPRTGKALPHNTGGYKPHPRRPAR